MHTKKCNKCEEEKPLSEFGKHKNAPDGLRYSCKKCSNVKSAEYRKKYSEKYKKAVKRWQDNNPDKVKEYAMSDERRKYLKEYRQRKHVKKKQAEGQRKYREKNPEKTAHIQWKSSIKRMYGVTPEWYEEKLIEQDGKCAICGTTDPGRSRSKKFSIDHDHKIEVARGLLCSKCNTLIGLAGECNVVLKAAISYLKKFS